MNKEVWKQIKNELALKNSNNPTFNALLESLSPINESQSSSGTQINFSVPTKYHKNWIKDHFIGQIRTEISKVYKPSFHLELKVEGSKDKSKTSSKQLRFDQVGFYTNGHDKQASLKHKVPQKGNLRPDFTFNTFVVGPNNEFAHAASFQVSESPGDFRNNPLFIFGPNGLGKTHLLNAIGNHIKLKQPQVRLTYVSAERFLKECVLALRHKKMDGFQTKYREHSDLLLIDDIHTLSRGSMAQEEFFHTLNSLFELKKQVVVACDRMPKDLNGLEERIQTRLEGGLIVDIQKPDLETKMAILRYKCEAMSVNISDDVIQYLANISNRSVRELEGNLNKVRMFSKLQGLKITVDLTKKVLTTHDTHPIHTLNVETIQKLVCRTFKIKPSDLKSKNRQKSLIIARQIAMKLVKKHLNKTLKEIGEIFGGKDHTTVLSNIKKIDEKLTEDAQLYKVFKDIESRIHNIHTL